MSKKYVMVSLACLMAAGVLFCGCDSKKEEGIKPEPTAAGKTADPKTAKTTDTPTPTGGPNVEIFFC